MFAYGRCGNAWRHNVVFPDWRGPVIVNTGYWAKRRWRWGVISRSITPATLPAPRNMRLSDPDTGVRMRRLAPFYQRMRATALQGPHITSDPRLRTAPRGPR